MKRKREEKKTRSQGKRDNANKKRQAILDNPPTNMRIADMIVLSGLARVGFVEKNTSSEVFCNLNYQPFYILDRLDEHVDELYENFDSDVPPAWVPGWYEDRFPTGQIAFYVREDNAFIFFEDKKRLKPFFAGMIRRCQDMMTEIAPSIEFSKFAATCSETANEKPHEILSGTIPILWVAMKLLACSNADELITDGSPRTNATKAYAAARKCTLPEYRPKVVDLWLPRSPKEASESKGGVGSKQRFHTRCGHIKRIMKGGERVTIYIAPYTAGDINLGLGPRKQVRVKRPA